MLFSQMMIRKALHPHTSTAASAPQLQLIPFNPHDLTWALGLGAEIQLHISKSILCRKLQDRDQQN